MQEAGASGSQDKIVLIIAIWRIRMVKGPQKFYAAMGTITWYNHPTTKPWWECSQSMKTLVPFGHLDT